MALNEAGNPARCPCCWECGDCMPFTYVSETCPAMNFGNFLCRSEAKPDWVTPSYTPKCKASWDDTGVDCIYGSGTIANDTCSCIGYFGAYCIDDPDGTNGRSWVVEFWCTDGLGGPATNFNTVVQDWTCACLGARFAYSLIIGGCCCECGVPDCDCTPPSTLYMDVTGCWEAAGVELTYDLDDGCWKQLTQISSNIDTAQLCCVDGAWTIQLTPVDAGCLDDLSTAATGGSCSPFDLTFPDITLSVDCCFPAGGTISITVSE